MGIANKASHKPRPSGDHVRNRKRYDLRNRDMLGRHVVEGSTQSQPPKADEDPSMSRSRFQRHQHAYLESKKVLEARLKAEHAVRKDHLEHHGARTARQQADRRFINCLIGYARYLGNMEPRTASDLSLDFSTKIQEIREARDKRRIDTKAIARQYLGRLA
jgi:hypothetical protein